MPKHTTTSNFKRVLAAAIVLALMVAGTEWYIYANRPGIITDYWNKFIINEHLLTELPRDFDYLIIGDSIQKTGIDPAALGGKVLNLGLPGGKPLGLYLLFKRYLAGHKPPKAVFLYVDPEDRHDSLLLILSYFVSVPEAASVWKDLKPLERQIFLMRYWASLDLKTTGLVLRDKYPYTNDVFVETLISNRGYMASPRADKALAEDHFNKASRRIQKEVSFTATDFKYLDKFMRLAEEKGVKVVFLGFLLPEERYRIFEDTGFNASYRAFYNGLRSRYPGAGFVDEPIIYFPNRYFGDDSHVNKEGLVLYTEYFKDKVYASFTSSTSPKRK